MFNEEELARAIRSGNSRLRVDRVFVTAGTAKFRGEGVLIVSQERLRLELALLRNSKFPEPKSSCWSEGDFWEFRGIIEHSVHFSATHVIPGDRSSSGWPAPEV